MTLVPAPAATQATPARLRLNNVAHLRLLFAASVVLSHAAALTGDDRYYQLRVLLNSEAAVQGFFILSGFLVCGSYTRLGSVREFYRRRLARIYPAYAFAILLFLVLALSQAVATGAAIVWGDVPPYLAANLLTLNFLKPGVGGVFANNYVHEFNGALWSIKVELMFYASLPLIMWLGRRTSLLFVSAAMIVAGTLWWPMVSGLFAEFGREAPLSLKFQLPGQLLYFGLGLGLFGTSIGTISRAALIAMTLFALALALAFDGMTEALHIAALVLLIGVGTALPQAGEPFGGNDISYSIYLSHFPIIQMLMAAGAGALPFPVYIATVAVLVIVYGLASWQFIERPALRQFAPARV